MKILTIIPARAGSKGVKNKNIKLLAGKPLISWTIEAAIKTTSLDEIIVSTDSMEIAHIASESGAEIPFIRPTNLAADTSKSIDVILHAINFMEKKFNITYDWILTLQPTTPMRSHIDITKALKKISNKTSFDSIISVVRVSSHHPALMKRIENGKLVSYGEKEIEGTRRQDYSPAAYMRNGAIYLTKRDVVVFQKSLWGEDICPLEMPEDRSINIDSNIDYLVAEAIIKM